MRSTDYQARWSVIRPQYGEYLPSYQRKEAGGSVSHSRVTRIPVRPQDAQEVQPTLRKMPSNKDHVLNTAEQSKIISALKSELSNLKHEVTKLIYNDKDFSTAHNSVQSHDLPAKQIASSTELHDHGKQIQYTNQNSSTIQRKPSIPIDSSDNKTARVSELATTHRQVYSDTQLREDLKASQIREKKLTEERDELARTLGDKSRELESLKQNNDTRSERLTQNKEASERQLNNIIETIRKQNSQAEQYYTKRIRELEANIKDLSNKFAAKDNELASVKQQLNALKTAKKEQQRQTKVIEGLQETNRTLTNQVVQLQQKIRQQQIKLSSAEQARNYSDNQIKRLTDQINYLRDQSRRYAEEITKTREDRDSKLRQKIRQIQQISLQKDQLFSFKDQLQKQLDKQKEIHKAELSKSSIVLQAQQSAQAIAQQVKKQEFDSLLTKIDTLKKDKRAIEHDIKGLIDTKQAIERSLSNIPQNKTTEELRTQLSQKEQIVNNLLVDVKNAQAEASKNRLISQRLKANQAVVRQLNELVLKNELASLNKRYS